MLFDFMFARKHVRVLWTAEYQDNEKQRSFQ